MRNLFNCALAIFLFFCSSLSIAKDVDLVSVDGKTISTDEKIARKSLLISNMLDDMDYAEKATPKLNLHIKSKELNKINEILIKLDEHPEDRSAKVKDLINGLVSDETIDIIQLLVDADYLLLDNITIAAARIWVDRNKEELLELSKTKDKTKSVKKLLKKQGKTVPEEPLRYLATYLDWIDGGKEFAIVKVVPVGKKDAGITAQGPIVVGDYVYAVDSFNNQVIPINIADDKVGAAIQVGKGPTKTASIKTKLYVANSRSQTISVIDTETNILESEIKDLRESANILGSFGSTLIIGCRSNGDVLSYETAKKDLGLIAGVRPYMTGGKAVWARRILSTKDRVYVSYGAHDEPKGLLSAKFKGYTSALSGEEYEEAQTVPKWSTNFNVPAGEDPYMMHAVQDKLFVADIGSNDIHVISTIDDLTLAAPIPVGKKPWGMADIDNKLYVANTNSNNVSVIDIGVYKTIGEPIAVCESPFLLIAKDKKIYVACKDNVSIIDSETDKVIGNIELSPAKSGSTIDNFVSARNKLYLVRPNDAELDIIDLDLYKERSIIDVK